MWKFYKKDPIRIQMKTKIRFKECTTVFLDYTLFFSRYKLKISFDEKFSLKFPIYFTSLNLAITQ